jgi:penicillin-binding protein 2
MSKRSQKDHSHNFEQRLYTLQYLLLGIFVALGIRFYILQVAHHQIYQQQAENNRIRETPILAPRGAIYDREGRWLVDNRAAKNMVIYPESISNKDDTIRFLVDELGVDRSSLMADLNDPHRPRSQPILVKQNASEADSSKIAAHEYEHPEVKIEDQPQRIYPNGSLAAHVLGYIGEISSKELEDPKYAEAGYKPGDIIGKGGVEKYYDKMLRGRDGKKRVVVDSRGRPIRDLDEIPPIKGQDIVLTIDLDLQRTAEDQFDNAHETGVAVAEDPQNGEILAMVSKPTFDPNVFAANVISAEHRDEVNDIVTDPDAPLLNKAIQGRYPTGSTWKIMMATAALEEGIITPKNSRIVCGGGIQVGNRFVHCMKNHGAPEIHAAIVQSCDGYFYRLGLKLGVDKIHEWVSKFGMGDKTGIDLPSESRGNIPDREWKRKVNPRDPVWKDFDTVMAAVGQGSVAVTPMELLRAEAGIMMDGQFHTPHLLKEARATQLSPVIYYTADQAPEIMLSKITYDIVSYGAWGVVNEGGTAGSVGFPRDLNVGGKTGTAQVIAREKVRGAETKDHSWFISFAPLHTDQKPQLAVVVLTEHGGFGARASAPKSKMINAVFFSKKLGRPILPELIAKNEPPVSKPPQSQAPAVLSKAAPGKPTPGKPTPGKPAPKPVADLDHKRAGQ